MAGNYTKVNVILTENQLSKLKHALANDMGVTLRIDGKTVRDGNHELLLTQLQINKLTNAYNPVNIKFSKTQLRKMVQSGGLGFPIDLSPRSINYLKNRGENISRASNLVQALAPSLGLPKGLTNFVARTGRALGGIGETIKKIEGGDLDFTEIEKALQNNKGIKLNIDKNMPDALRYVKFLTPSQINKIVSSSNSVDINFTA